MNDAFALTPAGETCDMGTVARIANGFVGENDKRIRETLRFVTDKQKAVLYAIAQDELVKAITSGAFTKRHHLKSPSSTQNVVKALLKAGLVTRSNGVYSVSDQLTVWIKSGRLNMRGTAQKWAMSSGFTFRLRSHVTPFEGTQS